MIRHVEHVTLLRDCNAVTIPSGEAVTLSKGREVVITQALGGSFTVNDDGRLLLIAGQDADALAQTIITDTKPTAVIPEGHEVNFPQIYEQLSNCYDPEIPINIVDLGLIYDVNCYQLLDGRNLIRIVMTLTAFGCGMGSLIAEEVKTKCLKLPNVDEVEVTIVFDPPWNDTMLSDVAKLELGLL